MRGPVVAGPPAGASTNAPPVETRLAASQQRHRPGESPDALAPNAPPRLARFPPAHPCVRSRPRQILPRLAAAADAVRDCEGRQYPDSTSPRASSALVREEIPAMQRAENPAAAALTRQTRVP